MIEKGDYDGIANIAPLTELINPEVKKADYLTACELELEPGLNTLNALIKDKLIDQSRPVLVGVAGGSASGKTSAVADKIKEFFGDDAVTISMDDYYRGDKYFTAEAEKGNILNWDQPEALNLNLFREHLEILKSGQKINKPVYSFKTGETLGTEEFEPGKLIIVEGLFALDDSLVKEADIAVFVDISTHGRILRRIFRDVERTGRSPSDILKYFSDIVEPMHERYIQSTKKNADIVIKNEYNPKIESKRSKDYELQIKFKSDIDLNYIMQLGAEEIDSIDQTDYYCNPKGVNLIDSDEILRLREEGDRIVFTYKGPKVESDLRKRPRLEFEIDEDTTRSFLSIYNDYVVDKIKKHRTTFHLDDVVFSMDSVSRFNDDYEKVLGDFIEFKLSEGQSIGDLDGLLLKLGLSINDAIKIPYSEM